MLESITAMGLCMFACTIAQDITCLAVVVSSLELFLMISL